MAVKGSESITNGKNGKQVENAKEKVEEPFIPPDGGWGWMIVLAAGFSNFCILPIMQSFGLIFKDRFDQLGINSSQTTTILNINCAVTSCIGLANGPLFRKYSYRQVSFIGGLVCAISITILSTMETFPGVLVFFSILYGIGIGITMSSNALALNTYFKDKRRIATGLSWTCTGLGPIIMPQIITVLMPIFGMQGTVLIFGGFAFNAVASALLLQPVSWHIKKKKNTQILKSAGDIVFEEIPNDQKAQEYTKKSENNLHSNYQSRSLENVVENTKTSYGALNRAKEKFGSQYLYYDDEEDGASGIDVIGSGTPMMSRANDGWFSRRDTSNASLTSRSSKKESLRSPSRRPSTNLSRSPSLLALSRGSSVRNLNRQNSETENYRRKISGLQPITTPLIILSESCEHVDDDCKDPNCKRKQEPTVLAEKVELNQSIEQESPDALSKKSLWWVIAVFFDLDLLRDPVYVNLMLGITFANFAELNFSLLTPFILGEYGFSKMQIATTMSILAGVDVLTRLTIPFVAGFIGWQNRTFFLIGVMGIAVGRIVLAHQQDFRVTLAVAVLIGIGKALRTIFMALVIPTHVPLSRLPGATGIQLLASGIVSLILGPVVGWIRDFAGDYAIMLHCLNIFTYLTVISWSLEIYFTRRKAKKAEKAKEDAKKELTA